MMCAISSGVVPATTRRVLLWHMTGLVVSAFAGSALAQEEATIVQPQAPAPAGFMERAFVMRQRAIERGDQPYGAVIVKAGRIVGEGVSAVITAHDPTAHAEMQAIRDAARRLRSHDLSGCEMYSTSRACTMCEAGAYWAHIARLYYAMPIVDAGVPQIR